MAEKLKELLEKINQEGIIEAEAKAKAIESEAKLKAERIIKDAKGQAGKIIEDARSHTKRIKEATDAVLKQSSRNLILALKEDIKSIFSKVIAAETAEAMSHSELASILEKVINNFAEKNGESSDLKVLLNPKDLKRLKKTFILKLKEKLKMGIEFKPAANIDAGFSISFDKGKSFFDFTDEGLSEALCIYLNPELERLFK